MIILYYIETFPEFSVLYVTSGNVIVDRNMKENLNKTVDIFVVIIF